MAALDVWSWIKSLSRAHARDSTRQLGHSVIYVFLEEWKSLEDLGVQDRTINRFILKKLFFGKNELGYQWWGVNAHQWVIPAPSQPFNRFFSSSTNLALFFALPVIVSSSNISSLRTSTSSVSSSNDTAMLTSSSALFVSSTPRPSSCYYVCKCSPSVGEWTILYQLGFGVTFLFLLFIITLRWLRTPKSQPSL